MEKSVKILDKMERLIASRKMNYFDLVLYDGEDWHTRELIAVQPCQNCYSITKAFTATAIGVAQDMNLLSVYDTIDRFFAKEWPENPDPELKNVTIRHLLTHTMGLTAGSQFGFHRHYNGLDNWLEHCLTSKLKGKPGENYIYGNQCYQLLSCIISRVTGMTMDRFVFKHLFRPLKIHSYAWATCSMGETQGGANLYISTVDMAKLGVLYMNKGLWEGKRILSEEWVNSATRVQTGHIPGVTYGFGMNVTDNGFTFGGSYNQYVVVRPDLNMVIAAHGFVDVMGIDTVFDNALSQI